MARRSVSAPDNTNPSRQFLFIDSSTDRAASSEAVRVHVMRQSHRSRREQSGQAHSRRTPDEITIFGREATERRRGSLAAQTDQSISSASASEESIPINLPSPIDWIHAVKNGLVGYEHRSLADLESLTDACKYKICLNLPLLTSSRFE